MKVLDEEVFVERENYFTNSNFVEHHKCNQILLLVGSVIDHIHIDNVVLHYDVIALVFDVGLYVCISAGSPDLNSMWIMRPLILYTLLAFVFKTQLKDDIENASADVKIAQIADHVLELLFFANLKPVFVDG